MSLSLWKLMDQGLEISLSTWTEPWTKGSPLDDDQEPFLDAILAKNAHN